MGLGSGSGFRITVLVLVAAETAQDGAARVLLQSALDHGDPLETAVDAVARQAQQPARLHHGRREAGEPRRAAQVEAEEATVVGAANVPAVGVPASREGWSGLALGYDRACGWAWGWSCGECWGWG